MQENQFGGAMKSQAEVWQIIKVHMKKECIYHGAADSYAYDVAGYSQS